MASEWSQWKDGGLWNQKALLSLQKLLNCADPLTSKGHKRLYLHKVVGIERRWCMCSPYHSALNTGIFNSGSIISLSTRVNSFLLKIVIALTAQQKREQAFCRCELQVIRRNGLLRMNQPTKITTKKMETMKSALLWGHNGLISAYKAGAFGLLRLYPCK